LRWLSFLEEKYGVIFAYIPGKKNVVCVYDNVSSLDIDFLKIQKEEILRLLS
jgi:hypothetical protein